MEGRRQNGEWHGAPEAARQQGRAGSETKSRPCQESRSQDKAGAQTGLRVAQELSQRVGVKAPGPNNQGQQPKVTMS